ncbi:MAG: ArsA-related P-loop ATPase [Nitrosomonas sp.]|uniref:nucleotide-binding protein n=1 Tax=Nitrosomonas sp. TaxID=42353 RepID=UPI0027361EA4|nr:ArsA-related P-loop ATPase [Nitrosomonas sp.]MDP1933489.1 ArsA-related P-loop ATPase [Nitrosomonas sp.]MDP3662488.1 ArsA-related P-loop ATPase [Nitrosomonas sp.]MDZ4107502.1 ArsA-related P-loop ATPase [Nitrosomonas sp.]
MAKIHMVLQGKGGVGKSFIASIIAQHCYAKKKDTLCIDTDPVNATFLGFKKLNVKKLDLMEGDEIDPRKFDNLVELISKSKSDVVIDNGASTFVALSHYLISNHIPALLKEMGHELIVHTVITGGQALSDTLNGFDLMIKQFSGDITFVVWLNPFWGKIESNGKSFESMKVYLDNKSRVSAIIKIPDYKAETFGRDLSEMLQAKLTFDDAIDKPELTIMMRQRLKIVKSQLFEQLEGAQAVLA